MPIRGGTKVKGFEIKLTRYGDLYWSRVPSVIETDGAPQDASSVMIDFGPITLAKEPYGKLKAINPAKLFIVNLTGKRFAPSVAQSFNL